MTISVTLMPKFRTPQFRYFRAGVFVAMGLSAFIPIVHGVRVYGLEHFSRAIALFWLLLQGVLYSLGAAIYAARVPERWFPGSFDIWGSSHQIFHVLVLIAAAAQLVSLVKAFDNRHSQHDFVPTMFLNLDFLLRG